MTKKRNTGLTLVAKTKRQTELIDSISDFPVTFAIGSAGGGKTYIATAKAVEYVNYRLVERIIVVRPAVATEDLGFLPGDMKEKLDPYLLPIWDAVIDVAGREQFVEMQQSGQLHVAPLAFMRGRTFNNSFIILDEAQNTTKEQMKMFLTRFGENVKVVITGDLSQSDIPGTNGLQWAIEQLAECRSVNIVKFVRREVVRSALTRDLLQHLEKRREPVDTHLPDSSEDTRRDFPNFIVAAPI